MSLEQAQKESLERIVKSIKRNRYPSQVMYFINYKPVNRTLFLAVLEQEGAYKLPFAYSRKSKSYYLLTEDYLKENNKRV